MLHRGTGDQLNLSTSVWSVLTTTFARPTTESAGAAALEAAGHDSSIVRDLVARRFLVDPAHDYWQDYAGSTPTGSVEHTRLLWTNLVLEHGLFLYPTWLGAPVLQPAEDLVYLQMMLGEVRPAYLVETGLFRGGGALFVASIFELLGRGQVISVELEVKPEARELLASHPLGKRITLVEGSSTDPAIVARVRDLVGGPAGHVVVLDADHSTQHVAAELEAYAPLVVGNGKLVVSDTSMSLVGSARASNPHLAVRAFLAAHGEEWRISPWAGAPFVTFCEDGVLERLPAE